MYGFTHEPFILPAFLTHRAFALELIRHKLIVENEHFISFKKNSEMKFPWVIGPFIIKNKDELPVVESLLKGMVFKIVFVVNYDPQYVISTRIQVNKNKPFEHQEVEGLVERKIWLDYTAPMERVEASPKNPLESMKATKVVTPIIASSEVTCKRNFSNAMETK